MSEITIFKSTVSYKSYSSTYLETNSTILAVSRRNVRSSRESSQSVYIAGQILYKSVNWLEKSWLVLILSFNTIFVPKSVNGLTKCVRISIDHIVTRLYFGHKYWTIQSAFNFWRNGSSEKYIGTTWRILTLSATVISKFDSFCK